MYALLLLAAAPNVLVVLADDLGFSDPGCYGGEIRTPNLDALAAGGLRYTAFYNTARCWPTRGAILTGFYAQQIRRDTLPGVVSGTKGTRPAWAVLLPQMLRPLGYRSYHSGKWHIDGKPLANGFDRSYSLEDHDRHFAPKRHTEDDKALPTGRVYTSTQVADHAVACLKEHAEQHADKPFFAFVAFTAPHFPLHAPPDDIARYRDTYRRGWDVMRAERGKRQAALKLPGPLSPTERDVGPPYAFPDAIEKLGPGEVNRPLPWAELSDVQRAFQADKMAVHAAMVDRMDQEIGRIVAQLKAMKAFDDTLILFLSDNGASAEIMVRGDGHDSTAAPGSAATYLCLGPGWSGHCNAPFRRHKTWVHEGGICTPLIAHWPKGIAAKGELRHTPGHAIDVVPTVLQLAGGKGNDKAPGRSLVPTFANDPVGERELWWLHEGNRALRVGDWKIVAAGKAASWELYDLAKDRTETTDLAAKMPARVRAMADRWQKQYDAAVAVAK